MTGKRFIYALRTYCTLVFVSTVLCGCQSALLARHGFSGAGEVKKSLKLVAEYRQNKLKDLSADSRLILFYQTSTPLRTYTFRPGVGVRPDQPEVYDDLLRVVELASGREVGRISTQFYPFSEQFVPGTQQVFYSEPKPDPQRGRLYKLWNVTSGQMRVCLDAPEGDFSWATFLNSQQAIGTVSQQNGEEILSRLNLPDCNITALAPVQRRLSSGFRLSPNKQHLIHAGSGRELVVRNVATGNIVKRFTPPEGLFFTSNSIYTPDGKFFLVFAYDKINPTLPGTKSYLLFYQTTNYEPVRRLEIESGSAMAVSPDSRLLAVGYTKEEKKAFSVTEQAQVVLYDLATGEEVARASHPPVKQQRSDPFAAKITRLAFTPD